MPALYTVAATVYPALHAVWRQEEDGVEHIPSGGFVLAANHVSNLDPFALGWALWPDRVVHWMAKAELHNGALDAVMRAFGTFPIRRGEVDTGALRAANELLRSGEVIGMFPEGTRRSKGLRKKFQPKPHPGTARIALTAGVPLVPAAISGTDRLTRRGPIRIRYGPAVQVDDLAGMPRRNASEIATERLMQAIESLYAEIS
ncbi:MAG TPA: lysophospholipid acyltransferase family protein [Gaiellaceae bacterium]|nr:lysophospholipid acyltransferase family protein [Gaiellaceae bacterium]